MIFNPVQFALTIGEIGFHVVQSPTLTGAMRRAGQMKRVNIQICDKFEYPIVDQSQYHSVIYHCTHSKSESQVIDLSTEFKSGRHFYCL